MTTTASTQSPRASTHTPTASIRRVIAGSFAAGLVVALLLVATPLLPAEDHAMTGAVLWGAAFGWALLAGLSVRFSDQPQRWAAAPAAFLALGGTLLVFAGPTVDDLLGWVWPPALLGLVLWMAVRAQRGLRGRSGRWLLYPVFALLALTSIGGGYQTVRGAVDAVSVPMPGQLVDIGGYRLHLSCTGSGSPTVVLEPGAGAMSSSLGWITPSVARETRVCVYDRAGRGWSEPANPPADGEQTATDLHTLLHRADVPGPYVLAGHSFGGLYALTFAAHYPDEVAGLVLVDSTAPAPSREPASVPPSERDADGLGSRLSALVSAAARLGVGQLYGQLAADGLPPQVQDEVHARSATVDNLRSTVEEYRRAGSAAASAAELSDFADKPLVVLTAGRGSSAGWADAQDRLAALSTNSAHRTVDDATHTDLVADPEKATVTSQAILDVLVAVRSATSLHQ